MSSPPPSDSPLQVLPPEPYAQVWRYMTLPKYLSLLQTGSLHFGRLDLMEDSWEGAPHMGGLEAEVRNLGTSRADVRAVARQSLLNLASLQRRSTYVSCWHMAEEESAAMWSLYQQDKAGIAIQTDWYALNSSLDPMIPFLEAQVVYGSHFGDGEDGFNLGASLCTKRRSFAHEREARIIYLDAQKEFKADMDYFKYQGTKIALPRDYALEERLAALPSGVSMKTDIETLVARVILAPYMPPWVEEAVRETTATFGFTFPVGRSSLDTNFPGWES